MKKELYFDISTETAGGSLYRITGDDGTVRFSYQHSTYDPDRDEVKVFETAYPVFDDWWRALTANAQWFYGHPLFVHPDIRLFVQEQLQKADWSVAGDRKWQESHRRQWKKVLEATGTYYRGQ